MTGTLQRTSAKHFRNKVHIECAKHWYPASYTVDAYVLRNGSHQGFATITSASHNSWKYKPKTFYSKTISCKSGQKVAPDFVASFPGSQNKESGTIGRSCY